MLLNGVALGLAIAALPSTSLAQLITVTEYPSACSAIYTSGSSSATVVRSTVTVSPTTFTDASINGGTPFAVEVQPAGSYKKRQAESRTFLDAAGYTTTDSSKAVQYRIIDGTLVAVSGGSVSADNNDTSVPFAVSTTVGSLTTRFFSQNLTLGWNNTAFQTGAAEFFIVPVGNGTQRVVAYLKGAYEDGWIAVSFALKPTGGLGIETSTGLGSTSVSTVVSMGSMPAPSASATPIGNVNPNGYCGISYPEFNCYGAPSGNCCSQYGYCGSTEDFCGAGCQSGYGECDETPVSSSAAGSPAVSTTVVPTVTPIVSDGSTSWSSVQVTYTSTLPQSSSPPQYTSGAPSGSFSTTWGSVSYTASNSAIGSQSSLVSPIVSTWTSAGVTYSSTVAVSPIGSWSTLPTYSGGATPIGPWTSAPVYGSSTAAAVSSSQSAVWSASSVLSSVSSLASSQSSSASSVWSASSSVASVSFSMVSSAASQTPTLLPPLPSSTASSNAPPVYSSAASSVAPPVYSSAVSSAVSSIASAQSSAASSYSSASYSIISSSSSAAVSASSAISSVASVGSSAVSSAASSQSSAASSVGSAVSSIVAISSSAASSAASASATADYAGRCPDDDGKTITDPQGVQYVIGCGDDLAGSNVGAATVVQNSYIECLTLCDANEDCDGVVWSGYDTVNGVGAGYCYFQGFDEPNSFVTGRGDAYVAAIKPAYLVGYTGPTTAGVTPATSSMQAGVSSAPQYGEPTTTTTTTSAPAYSSPPVESLGSSAPQYGNPTTTTTTTTAPSAPAYSSPAASSSAALSVPGYSSPILASPSMASSSAAAVTSSAPSAPSYGASSSATGEASSTSSYLVLASPTPCSFGDGDDQNNDDLYCEIDTTQPVQLYSHSDTVTFASTNGFITLTEGSSQYQAEQAPTDTIPDNAILPFFDDLYVYGGQTPRQGIFSQQDSNGITYEYYVVRAGQVGEIYHFTVGYNYSTPGVFVYTYYAVGQGNDGQFAGVGIQGDDASGSLTGYSFSYQTTDIVPGLIVTCDTTQNICTSNQ